MFSRRLLLGSAFAAGLATLVFWPFAHGITAIMLYAALFGICSGGFNALVVPSVGQISEVRQIGTRIGMLYSMISFP